MTLWALMLEYDGSPFVGWQRQDNGLSVQDVLEAAAAQLARGAPVSSVVAGRTDAGVHAEAQVAQLALPALLRRRPAARRAELPHEAASGCRAARRAGAARAGMRGSPPSAGPIAIASSTAGRGRRCWPDGSGTCTRRSTPRRCTRRRSRCWAGTISRSFRAAACQAKSPLRTLDRLDVTRDGDIVEIVAEARSFLHHQVRNMVGTLRLVGDGHWPPARVAAALAAMDRSAAGPTAPAEGLYLTGVRYAVDPFG